MDPARRARMLSGRESPSPRDITAPKRDNNTRISKPSNPPPASRSRQKDVDTASGAFKTQDEQANQFVADEDRFVLKQTKKKADIRVREGRAEPIDLLVFLLRFVDQDRDTFDDEDDDAKVSLRSPEDILQALNDTQLAKLDSDITHLHTLELHASNREYWKSLQTLCADRRQKLKPQGTDERVVNTVSADVDKILSPKSYEQLEALEKQVRSKLRSDEDIDTDYWEQLLRSLLVWKAKAKLKKVFDAILETRKSMLGHDDASKTDARQDQSQSASRPSGGALSRSLHEQQWTQKRANEVAAASAKADAPPPGTARFAQAPEDDFSQATKALYDREVARGVGENEEIFTAEESLATSARPQWADKFRPRKPKYFNRVQMGYDWNKYNQTHYDHDNPPPKVVQGYKFNIFYPELIDKTKAPTYKLIREHGRKRGESFAPAGEEDTCLIRFVAGPPYEDIAFRIVDREWDFSAKRDRGYRSSFDKGILQVHFQFKKVFYRK